MSMVNATQIDKNNKIKEHSTEIAVELAYTKKVVHQFNNCYISKYSMGTFGKSKIKKFFKDKYNLDITLRSLADGDAIAEYAAAISSVKN